MLTITYYFQDGRKAIQTMEGDKEEKSREILTMLQEKEWICLRGKQQEITVRSSEIKSFQVSDV